MKQFSFLLVLACLVACNANEQANVKSATETEPATEANAAPAYAYTPSYSATFEVGDPHHAKTVLDLFKTWDNNTPEQSKQLFADSMTIFSADGNVMSGATDSILKSMAPYRNSLGTVSSKVHAWVPLKSTDKNENWVLVWFTEYRTNDKGKMDSSEFQETWRLNKEGRADMLMQYERKFLPAKN